MHNYTLRVLSTVTFSTGFILKIKDERKKKYGQVFVLFMFNNGVYNRLK